MDASTIGTDENSIDNTRRKPRIWTVMVVAFLMAVRVLQQSIPLETKSVSSEVVSELA